MRPANLLLVLIVVCGCAGDDAVSKRQYGQQLVCHKNKTMAVSNADMFGHQDHGDALGPCPEKP
jgi:hypothetical protein